MERCSHSLALWCLCFRVVYWEREWFMLIQMGTPQEATEQWPELWQKWGRAPQTPLLSFLSSSGGSKSGQNLQNRTSYFFRDVENTPAEHSRIKTVGLLIERLCPVLRQSRIRMRNDLTSAHGPLSRETHLQSPPGVKRLHCRDIVASDVQIINYFSSLKCHEPPHNFQLQVSHSMTAPRLRKGTLV